MGSIGQADAAGAVQASAEPKMAWPDPDIALASSSKASQVTHKGKPHQLTAVDLCLGLAHGGIGHVNNVPFVSQYEEDRDLCKAVRQLCDLLGSITRNGLPLRLLISSLANRIGLMRCCGGVLAKSDYTTGVMSSWQIDMTDYGCVLTVYVGGSSAEVKHGAGQPVMIALTDAQLRVVLQDLLSAVDLFDLEMWGRPSLWRRLFSSRRN